YTVGSIGRNKNHKIQAKNQISGAQPHDPRGFVDRGGLHGGDLVLAQGLAHNVEPAREWGITEGPLGSLCLVSLNNPDHGLFWIDEWPWALAKAAAIVPMVSPHRCVAARPSEPVQS